MAKSKTNGTKVETAVKVEKPTDDNAITASMFTVTVEGVGGGGKWRVTIEANDSHPTESGVVYMATYKGELGEIDNTVSAAISDLCDDE